MKRRATHQGISRARRDPAGHRRGGAVTLELILTMPIWIIVLLAIIEFGQILSNQQQLSLASRVGAEEASQTLGLESAADVPANVLIAINQQLASSGISECKVILEHNVVPPLTPTPVVLTSGECDCGPPSTPLPPRRQYVRVTVCAELTELAPNLLGTFGFDISDCIVQQTTTFRYEL